jgi:hypothetical protein
MRAYATAYECGENEPPVVGLHDMENLMKNTVSWTESQKKLAGLNTAVRMQWRGADFSRQIENKREPEKLAEAV